MIDVLPVAAYLADRAGTFVHCNRRAADSFGRSPLVEHPAATKAVGELTVGEFLRTAEPVRDREVVLAGPDGRRNVVLANIESILEEDGTAVGALGCFQDLAAPQGRHHPDRVLLDELDHRVKNTLATVQSFAHHTHRAHHLPREAHDDFERRLVALSRAHDSLTRGGWRPVDLSHLVTTAIEPYDLRRSTSALTMSGEPVQLGAQTSLTLSLVFHELASNAAKYGALSSPTGRVTVSWRIIRRADVPNLALRWEEDGGPRVQAPLRSGFGTRLVRDGIARQLRGTAELDYDPSGLRCTMEVPLSSPAG